MTTETSLTWQQLHIEADSGQAEEVAALLNEAGALAVSLSDLADTPIYEPGIGETPVWEATRVTGLFPASADLTAILEGISERLDMPATLHASTERIADRAWERAWLDDYEPIDCGHGLWICPSDLPPPEPDAINIRLDPGLAFGSGTHPTTRLCLEWLASHAVANQEIVDFGCGSGILAIAAAMLGCRHVEAIDIDPQALQATRDNAARNAVTDRIAAHRADQWPRRRVDGLIANILARPLIELTPEFAACLPPGGWLVLSGILEEQADKVAAALAPYFTAPTYQHRDGWVMLACHRSA